MEEYKELVKALYESDSSDEISNSSREHASILVEYLFKYAVDKKEDVRIVTGCLESKFYDRFARVLDKIFSNGNSVSIMSSQDCEEGDFLQKVSKNDNGSIIKNTENSFQNLPHFILVGNSAYRVELDDDKSTARASFNRPTIGDLLKTAFNAHLPVTSN